jgi:glycosyltransferase involved in cell wall biosynthesis
MRPPRVAVVVPCYNTSRRCADVIAGAVRFADAILAIDDGSTDDTAEHLRASGCRVLSLPVNSGKGAALAAGFREVLKGPDGALGASVDYVVTMDGDGQHDPADIPRFLAAAGRSGAHLVLGLRRPRGMPLKNRIGAHFSRLLVLIGTATYVADTQSGFRLLTLQLLSELIDTVTWRGYESESEVLWRTLALRRRVSAVEVSTIYLAGNRGSQFKPWRDSARIAAVFSGSISWTVIMAMLDFALFGIIAMAGWLSPAWANVASRAIAVLAQLTLRRDYIARVRWLAKAEGPGWCLLVFVVHLTVTTALVIAFVGMGAHPVMAKAAAQLLGYLGTFAAVDTALLGRTFQESRL